MSVSSEAQSSAQQAQSGSPDDDYRDRFLTILNNRGKFEKDRDERPLRQQGFVILARENLDLTPLQTLCNDTQQNWNICLTARYRLRPGAIFGTLLAAFLTDLQEIRDSRTADLIGNFFPGAAEAAWKRFLDRAAWEVFPKGAAFDWEESLKRRSKDPASDGLSEEAERSATEQLESDQLERLLSFLASDKTLPTGERLVLFVEVDDSEAVADKQEWEMAAKTMLFRQLPERVGLVFSGAPTDFKLEEGAPHFLELTLPGDARFKQGSLHSDLPTDKDTLDVKNYAEALARFVMHPQTEPPLTIGIHGPWGKGKSSFMKLVDEALIEWAMVGRSTRHIRKLAQLQQEIPKIEQELKQAAEPEIAQLRYRHRAKSVIRDQLREYLAEPNVVTVKFNAWQFEDAKQIWAGLASVISARLERALPWWLHAWMRISYAKKERLSELLLYGALPLLVGLVILLYLVFGSPEQFEALLKNAAKGDLMLRDLSVLLLPLGSSLFLIWFASKQILSVVQPLSERVLSYIQLPTYREQMGYQHRVMEDLCFVYGYLQRHGLKSKVVVFIDDLDRCSEEKIMEVLQAIILILGDSKFFVFLGMDTEMIYRAIRVHYTKHQGNCWVLPADFPEEYLRKIIQVSFNLPEASDLSRQTYLYSLFSETSRRKAKVPIQSSTAASPETTQTTNEKPPVAPTFTQHLARRLRISIRALWRSLGSAGRQTSSNTSQATDDSQTATDGSLLVNFNHLRQLQPLEVEDTAVELETFREHLEFLKDNPREVKRLVNLHRLVKIILQVKQQQNLYEEEEQRKLVRWLIFCASWPDLIHTCLAIVKESPDSKDILAALIKKRDQADTFPPSLQRLKAFAEFGDLLSAQDIESFKLAAPISALIRESVVAP